MTSHKKMPSHGRLFSGRKMRAEDEGVGALPASALLSLPLGLLASVVLRY
jgi:hypothetical protein